MADPQNDMKKYGDSLKAKSVYSNPKGGGHQLTLKWHKAQIKILKPKPHPNTKETFPY